MNGVHDMGGMTDFGPIRPEIDEPLFHADWERRVFGMVRNVVDKRYNWDEFRFAIERLDPVVYLSASYYERWLSALERHLIEKGVLSEAELRERTAGAAPRPGVPSPAEAARAEVGTGVVGLPEVGEVPRFKAGDLVRARNIHPSGHTRLPRYVRGKQGTIDRFLGRFILPDSNALGLGEHLQPVYAVRFDASELWGSAAREGDSVCVDLWEGYLEPCEREGRKEAQG
jgi:nitrile hydratase